MTLLEPHVSATATSSRTLRSYSPTSTGNPQEQSGTTLSFLRVEPRARVSVDRRLASMVPTITRIVDLDMLQHGWDGEGAEPISREAISNVLMVFGSRDAPLVAPIISPRVDGGIHLEWSHGLGDMELDAEPDGYITLICEAQGEWSDYGFTSPRDPQLHELLSRVSAG